MKFNVNTDKLVAYTNRLEKLNRSAFPVVVRGTLNDAAFDVKTSTMPASARSNFEHRQKNFFKANSKFIKADGFNVKTMESNVGFFENKLTNQGHNFAIDDLNQQESAGTINKKAFIPLNPARVSGKGNVRANYRLNKIKTIVNANKQSGSTKGQRFIKAMFKAGVGGFILGSEIKGENILWKVNSLSSKLDTKKLDITPIYDYSKGRSVKVKSTHFMHDASMTTANKMDDFFIKRALDQYRKAGIIK